MSGVTPATSVLVGSRTRMDPAPDCGVHCTPSSYDKHTRYVPAATELASTALVEVSVVSANFVSLPAIVAAAPQESVVSCPTLQR